MNNNIKSTELIGKYLNMKPKMDLYMYLMKQTGVYGNQTTSLLKSCLRQLENKIGKIYDKYLEREQQRSEDVLSVESIQKQVESIGKFLSSDKNRFYFESVKKSSTRLTTKSKVNKGLELNAKIVL